MRALTYVFFLLTLMSFTTPGFSSVEDPPKPKTVKDKYQGVLFVFDNSGSMDGTPIRENARTVVSTLQQLREEDMVGLISLNTCDEKNIVYDPRLSRSPSAKERIRERVMSLKAEDLTPLEKAIRIAHREMVRIEYCPRMIILTDWADTCEGDPLKAIQENKDFCMEINVITRAVEAEFVKKFQQLTEATHGMTKVISSENEAQAAIEEIIARQRVPAKLSSQLPLSKTNPGISEQSQAGGKKPDKKAPRPAEAILEQEQKKEKHQ